MKNLLAMPKQLDFRIQFHMCCISKFCLLDYVDSGSSCLEEEGLIRNL